MGNLINATDADNHETSYQYDALNRLIKVTDATDNETSYTYDAVGNLINVTDANGHTAKYEYDKVNRLTKIISPMGHETQYLYDGAGNLIERTDANDNTTTYEYDAVDRLVQTSYPDNSNVTYEYGPVGNVVQITNSGELGDNTYYEYDELNRVKSFTLNYGLFSKTVSYTYDKVGNRKTMTDQDENVTNYEYDPLNQLIKITDNTGGVTTYEYDPAGNRIKMSYPNGVNTTYTYDNADRLVNITTLNSTENVLLGYVYEYDNIGLVVSRATKPPGLVGYWKFDEGSGTTAYDSSGYSNHGTLVNGPVWTTGQVDGALNFNGLDDYVNVNDDPSLDIPEKITIEAWVNVDNGSDFRAVVVKQANYHFRIHDGYLGFVFWSAGGWRGAEDNTTLLDNDTWYHVAVSFDTVNNIIKFYANGDNVKTMTNSWNMVTNDNPLTIGSASGAIKNYFNGTIDEVAIYNRGLTPEEIQQHYQNGLSGRGHENITTYEYDAANRLVMVTRFPSENTTKYTYDGAGNRLTKVEDGDNTTYTYDNDDRLLSENSPYGTTNYAYDNNGNRISKTSPPENITYEYDFEDKLIDTTFYYDGSYDYFAYYYTPEGKMLAKEYWMEDSEWWNFYVYDRSEIIARLDNTGNADATFVPGVSVTENGDISYIHSDGFCTTTLWTNDWEEIEATMEFDEFGNFLEWTGWPPDDTIQFRCMQHDGKTGLYRYNGIYYGPIPGTYLNDGDEKEEYEYGPINRLIPTTKPKKEPKPCSCESLKNKLKVRIKLIKPGVLQKVKTIHVNPKQKCYYINPRYRRKGYITKGYTTISCFLDVKPDKTCGAVIVLKAFEAYTWAAGPGGVPYGKKPYKRRTEHLGGVRRGTDLSNYMSGNFKPGKISCELYISPTKLCKKIEFDIRFQRKRPKPAPKKPSRYVKPAKPDVIKPPPKEIERPPKPSPKPTSKKPTPKIIYELRACRLQEKPPPHLTVEECIKCLEEAQYYILSEYGSNPATSIGAHSAFLIIHEFKKKCRSCWTGKDIFNELAKFTAKKLGIKVLTKFLEKIPEM